MVDAAGTGVGDSAAAHGDVGAQGAIGRAQNLATLIGTVTHHAAAILVAVETAILLAGVTCRYVFHAPLLWGDEVASLLFLWLIMLGAVAALAKNQHMRLTFLETRVRPSVVPVLHTTSMLLSLGFLLAVLLPAWEHFIHDIDTENPGLGISAGWRSAAMPIGLVLMALISILRMTGRLPNMKVFLVSTAIVVGVMAACYVLSIVISGNQKLIIFFVILFPFCVFIGVDIFLAFGIATVACLLLTTSVPLSVVVNQMEGGMAHIILLAVPMFMVLGLLLETAGLARVLINLLLMLVGHVRAGLSYALVGAMCVISGISGSKAADMAVISPVLTPVMKKHGVHEGEILSLMAVSAAMSETIPPSLFLIMIGAVVGLSIGDLFAAGLVPGLFVAVFLLILAYFRSSPADGSIPRVDGKTKLRALYVALPALLLPFVIRTTVVEGVATATEVATIGVAYTILVGIFIYRQFEWKKFYDACFFTASLTGAVIICFGTAKAMAWAITQSGFSQDFIQSVSSIPGGAASFMALSLLIFVVCGSVLEGVPAVAILGPFLFPVARELGIHEIHYAMVVILAMSVGLFAPPFGIGYYTTCAIAGIHPNAGLVRIWPYLGIMLLAVVVFAAIPSLSTFLLPVR